MDREMMPPALFWPSPSKEVPVRDAVVTIVKPYSLQVCVPSHWSDLQALEFAEDEEPCGTRSGWKVRGERIACLDGGGMVHLVVGV